jgi:hypothetical protein
MLKVAQVRISSCDLDNPQTSALSEAVNRLSFSPWHATDDHRPVGNVMRARQVAPVAMLRHLVIIRLIRVS